MTEKPKRKKRGWRKRVLLEGIDFGDGKKRRVWLTVSDTGVEIRQWHSWKRWRLPLNEAAELLVRKAQLRMVMLIRSQ